MAACSVVKCKKKIYQPIHFLVSIKTKKQPLNDYNKINQDKKIKQILTVRAPTATPLQKNKKNSFK